MKAGSLTAEVLGLDIGGANIKYCSSTGNQGSLAFELWKQPELLSATLQDIARKEQARHFAVTMTGEIADCFQSKAEGVTAICKSVEKAATNRPALFYQTSGAFVDAASASRNWKLTAASNWHALASLVGKVVSDCLVVDTGSTTTDLIPVRNGSPDTFGSTDLTRMASGELLYTGVVRSPVCAIVQCVTVEQKVVPVAQELFANMLDVYVILDEIQESNSCRHTADGRPATKTCSYDRLARMLCAETHELAAKVLDAVALQIATRHQRIIGDAMRRALDRHQLNCLVATGEGAFLIKRIAKNLSADLTVISPGELTNRFSQFRPHGINTAAALVYLLQEHLLQTA